MWQQKQITLKPKSRGFHLITAEIENAVTDLKSYRIGVAQLLLQHTSASLCLNENADPSVRVDFERYINRLAPEGEPYYTHTFEGDDDMPAHLKSSLLGVSLTRRCCVNRLNLFP